MKKFFTLFILALLAGNLAFGQIIISQVYEGTSNNKWFEISNVGTSSVNLASPQLTVKLFANKVDIGTNAPTSIKNLTGTLSAGQSMIYRHGSATLPAYAMTYTPLDTAATCNFNGTGSTSNPTASTDIIALYNGTTLIDVFSYGTFQYKDQSYYRNQSITAPNATWTVGEWTVATIAEVDAAVASTLPRLGYHTASTTPYLNISSPVNGATIYGTDITVSFSVGNFTIPASGHVHYTIDGGSVVMQYDANPIALTGLSLGSHTVAVWLVDPSHADLNPAVSSTTTFTVAAPTDVANLAALRASTADNTTVYRVTGEILLTFLQTYRNQKFLQDATGGILIDDASAAITTVYTPGDGITNVTGTLTTYNNMLQFTPIQNPGTPSSQGNTITPVSISLTELNTNFDAHESQLVKLTGVTFKDANGIVAFANGKGYAITNSVDSFYTNFYDVNYIAITVPSTTVNIIGLLHSRSTGNYITSRFAADIEGLNDVEVQTITNEIYAYPNPAKESITIKNLKKTSRIEISNILGQVMHSYSNISKDDVTLKLNGFNNGIYFISVIENNRIVKTMKFTKE